ncbi:MAG: transaldolase family protein, partial [Gemmatimonadaceae bacterium]
IEGADAIRRLIADGINVNVTLLFAIEAHERVIDAFIGGLEDRVAQGKAVAKIASVASFFVSRVDSAIDKQLDTMAATEKDGGRKEALLALCGKAAIANAKLAYRLFTKKFSGARWDALASKGALPQRPLWASTSTKNPHYRDVMYVEELAGPDTVNTLPPATLEAFRDHGEAHVTVDVGVDEAERVLAQLEAHGVSLNKVTEQLLKEGLASFEQSFVTLQAGLERKRAALNAATTNGANA